jgi:hypothetical protein
MRSSNLQQFISGIPITGTMTSAQLCELISKINATFMEKGGVAKINDVISEVQERETNTQALLCLLRTTYGARSRLPIWLNFLERVRMEFVARGADPAVLKGLDA